jgi:hypothetical protein
MTAISSLTDFNAICTDVNGKPFAVSCGVDTKLADSGDRSTFSTGSLRDNGDGKGLPSLWITCWDALLRVWQHFANGAKKYSPRNWELGQPVSRYIDAIVRHTSELAAGYRNEDHAAAIAWNANAFMHTEAGIASGRLPFALWDLPSPRDSSETPSTDGARLTRERWLELSAR